MQEKELKTSGVQRFWIIAIAVVMLGSVIASYAAIVANGAGSSSTSGTELTEEKIQQYTEEYYAAVEEFGEGTKSDFDEFVKYKKKVVAYNEAAANGINVKTEDLKKGTGKKIENGDTNYYAYYVGWCADETIFDASFNDYDNPTAFSSMIEGSDELIEGWILGIEGMRLGGVRMITIPGALAYGESGIEVCGGTSKPLKFIVMLKERTEELNTLYGKLAKATLRVQYATQYGLDYDTYTSGY